MAPAAVAHHHRSTTKVSHKLFKSRHATKGILRDLAKGKIQKRRRDENHKSRQQRVMSKVDRKNQSRQKQLLKQQQHAQSKKVFSGQNGAPRIVTVVPLCEDVHAEEAVRRLNASLEIHDPVPPQGICTVRIERFKQSLQYVLCSRDMLQALDTCRAADYVMLVLSASQEVDSVGETLLRAIESQGVSDVVTVVAGLDASKSPKEKQSIAMSLKSYITHFLPQQDRLHSLDAPQDCSNIIRSLCSSVPKGIHWRADRAWLLIEDATREQKGSNSPSFTTLTGFIRGSGLSANRLLQVGDWGVFQIERIVAAPLAGRRKRKVDEMVVDEPDEAQVLGSPDSNQDDLAEMAPEEVAMDDEGLAAVSEAASERKRVLLDDDHYFSEEEEVTVEPSRKLPRGTSSYQAAWYLDGMSDSGSDWEDEVDQAQNGKDSVSHDLDEEMLEDPAPVEATEGGPSEYPQSEMFLDPAPQDEAEQIAAYRSSRRQKEAEDLEFPDEIELHPNVLARERLARYRGLKNFKTSHWETDHDRPHEPEDWNRLLQISHYGGAKRRAIEESLAGAIPAGTRVKVYLKNGPLDIGQSQSLSGPLVAFSLHRHEQKRTVMNFNITLDSAYEGSIKSKEELVMQCGPRRFAIRPIFSVPGVTPNDVHKFERYLHPGCTAIATVIAPLTWGATPTLFFQRSATDGPAAGVDDGASRAEGALQLVGTGTALAPSSTRVVAKRAVLTGHPFKIHRRLVTVRYMFFNAADVRWFRALRLWTRRGRSGFVKESLGTHGYFKATFDGPIHPQDAVALSLYKRVWPRQAHAWRPDAEARAEGGGAVQGEMEMTDSV